MAVRGERLIQYKAYGEFLVPLGHPDPRHQKTTIDKAALPNFWSSVDEMHPGLSSACGIYIFGMRAGGGFTPWYVGKCNAKSGFKRECFSREKGSKYEEFLKRPEIQRGTPVLFLLPKLGTKLPFAKFSARHDPEIGWLEKEFIQLGILANPKLINRQSTRWVRQMVIPGVMNSPPGRHDEPTRKLRRLLNLYSVPRDRAGNITSEERQENPTMQLNQFWIPLLYQTTVLKKPRARQRATGTYRRKELRRKHRRR